MSTAVFRRFESRERDDDLGSEVSTIRGSNFFKSVNSDSDRTMRHVNSATYVKSQIYKCESFESDDDSDQASFHEDEIDEVEETIQKVTKIKKIDLSPEYIKKRQETYDKWLLDYIERREQQQLVARERRDARMEAQKAIEEERKAMSLKKTQEWMRKKRVEAEKKLAQLKELEKADRTPKPKNRKVTMSYDEWLEKKNESLAAAAKKQEDEKEKLLKSHPVRAKSSYSFENWSRDHSRAPKPVPMGQSLLSLKGSMTKIYVNPIPWKDD